MTPSLFQPIFIVGNSRSGTTLMARILGTSPYIYALNELHFFEQLWTETNEKKNLSRSDAENLGAKLIAIQRERYLYYKNPAKYLAESRSMLKEIADRELTMSKVYSTFLTYETIKNNKKLPCEQTPRNVFYIREILRLLPEARIINMIRDPRDVILSQKGKWKRRFLGQEIPLRETIRTWFNYHPIIMSQLWKAAVQTSLSFENNHRVFTLRFEDLVIKPHEKIQAICSFLEIQFDENMLNIGQSGSSNILDNENKRGLNPEVLGQWKNKLRKSEIYWCQKINTSLMKKYGYSIDKIDPDVLEILLSLLYLPFKLSFAFLLNLKRTRNLTSSIIRRFIN